MGTVFEVGLTGPDGMYKAKLDLIIGESIELRKDPGNQYSESGKAIKAFNMRGQELGFIMEDAKYGLLTCKDIYHLLENKETITGIVELIKTKVRNNTILSIKVAGEEKREKIDMNEKKICEMTLKGAKTRYPQKFVLLEEVKKGNKPNLDFVLEDDRFIGYWKEDKVGYIMGNAEELSFLEKGAKQGEKIVGRAVSLDNTNVVCEVEISEKLESMIAEESFEAIIEKVVSNKFLTEEELKSRLTYLEQSGVTKKQSAALFATYVRYSDEASLRIPQKPKTLYQDSNGLVRESVAYLNLKRNLMFEGDRGVGKNVLTETLAWLFKRPLYEFSLNSGYSNESLVGGKTIESTNPGNEQAIESIIAKFEGKEMTKDSFLKELSSLLKETSGGMEMGFEKTSIIEAAEEGGILVLDEFNTSIAHAMSLFNSLLDDRRRIQVPGYKLVEAHSNFVAIGTQNKEYVGTFETNEATSDRFVPIVFPSNKEISAIILAKIPNAKQSLLKICEIIYKDMKMTIEKGMLSEKSMTIRGFIDACMAVEMDISPKEAFIDNIANRCSEIEDRKIVESIIEGVI